MLLARIKDDVATNDDVVSILMQWCFFRALCKKDCNNCAAVNARHAIMIAPIGSPIES